MKNLEFRVDVFGNSQHKKYYFSDKLEAILFGQEKLRLFGVYGVFLSRHIVDGKYDTLCAIKG